MENTDQDIEARGDSMAVEPAADDSADGAMLVPLPGGGQIRLTARQREILGMPVAERFRIPFKEMYELGKLLHDHMPASVMEAMNHPEAGVPVPELSDEPYEYEALPNPTSLRLLRMLPRGEDGIVNLSIETFDLNEFVPRYWCLSYTNGNPHIQSTMCDLYTEYEDEYGIDNSYPVSLNGRLFSVRQNLYDALTQLPEFPGIFVKQRFRDADMNGLQIAAAQGDVKLVKVNFGQNAQVDSRDTKGRTALILAASQGHLEVVRVLLEAGADTSIEDFDRQTALEHALAGEHQEIVAAILDFDPSTIKPLKNENRRTGYGALFWIDAICINQEDLYERSAQVRVMDQIYSQAAFVTVWLGREDPFSSNAAKVVTKLFGPAAAGRLDNSSIAPYLVNAPEVFRNELGVEPMTGQEWGALAALYLRQNYRRLWTLQEMVLAQDTVTFLGPHEIPWKEFLFLTEKLVLLQRKFSIAPSMSFQPRISFPIEDEVHLLSELRLRRELDEASEEGRNAWFQTTKRFWRGEGKKCMIPLFEMLAATATFQCSDPRDHVYALLGMLTGHPECPVIDPDYQKPVEQLYAEVTRLIFRRGETGQKSGSSPSLLILSNIKDTRTKHIRTLPSWVHDFSQIGTASMLNRHFKASGDGAPVEAEEGFWNQLMLRGIKVDTVADVSTPRPDQTRVSKMDLDPKWFKLALDLPGQYVTGQSRTEVLWRTLIADQAVPLTRLGGSKIWDSPAPINYGELFRDLVCAVVLAFGDQAAQADAEWNSMSGVMFRALMGVEVGKQQQERGGSGAYKVKSSGDMSDKSLSGLRYRHPIAEQTLKHLDELVSEEGAFTPTRAQIEQYLANPKYRVWTHTPHLPADTQAMDPLPRGEEGFVSLYVHFAGGRRLFRTEGGLLGFGPGSVQEGDEVWVLAGSGMPFVLRRKRDGDDEEWLTDKKTQQDSKQEKESDIHRKMGVAMKPQFMFERLARDMKENADDEAHTDGEVADGSEQIAESSTMAMVQSAPAADSMEGKGKGKALEHEHHTEVDDDDLEPAVQHFAVDVKTERPIYRLVGEAYVHGIMHGEAVETSKQAWEGLVLE